jgi:YVTN family beta-propeller protein
VGAHGRLGFGRFGRFGSPEGRGRTAYVTNGNSDTVTPIRVGTDTAGRAIRVGRGPAGIAITP